MKHLIVFIGLIVTGFGCRSAVPPAPPATVPERPRAEAVKPPTPAIESQGTFKTASGRIIAIVESGEFDSYDKPTAPGLENAPSDIFAGSDRKAAKLSIVTGGADHFDSVQELVESLETDDDMINRQPPISRASNSRRVKEERRNAAVAALLVAASREEDNDFHLIICDEPDALPGDQFCFNVEVSGLPTSGTHLGRLRTARNQFSQLVGGNLPGSSYRFYSPPIPVRVEGSLFYDISHKPGAVGPKKFRPETAWEIHPVTAIVEQED